LTSAYTVAGYYIIPAAAATLSVIGPANNIFVLWLPKLFTFIYLFFFKVACKSFCEPSFSVSSTLDLAQL
jgi:hypothetical protein